MEYKGLQDKKAAPVLQVRVTLQSWLPAGWNPLWARGSFLIVARLGKGWTFITGRMG